MPGQDLLSDQPALPVLLGQRAVVRSPGRPGPSRAPRGRPRYVRASAFRQARRRGRKSAGITVVPQTRAERLVTGEAGRVIGVETAEHARRAGLGQARTPGAAQARQEAVPVRGRASAGGCTRPVAWLERRYARPLRIGARRGVVHRGRRLRSEPRAGARARARLPWRPCPGHGSRRRQRHATSASPPAAPRSSLTGSPAGGSSRRRLRSCAACSSTGPGSGSATSHSTAPRSARPSWRGTIAGRGWCVDQRNRVAVLAPASRQHAVVPAASGRIPADQGPGQRTDPGQGRRQGRRRRRWR